MTRQYVYNRTQVLLSNSNIYIIRYLKQAAARLYTIKLIDI